jgi:hypothetical protein
MVCSASVVPLPQWEANRALGCGGRSTSSLSCG